MLMRRAMRAREPTGRRAEDDRQFMSVDQLIDMFRSAEDARSSGAAMRSSPVAAAHRILTNSMGSLPVDLYEKKDGRRREVANHDTLHALTVRANEYMSPMIFKKVMMSIAFWHGESFAYIDRRGRQTRLIPMPPEPTLMEDDKTGERWYMFSAGDEGMARKFHDGELLHFFFDTCDGKRGIGFLQMARESLKTELNAQKYAGKFYTQGARPSGIIEVPTKLNNEHKENIRNTFERAVGGMDNAFRVAVMDMGMKYTQLGLTQKDAQYIESRQFTVEEVARFTGIPMHKLQAGKQSYESNEAQGIDYVVSTLQPNVVQWEEEMRFKLLSPAEQRTRYYKFNLAAEMRGDNASRARFYQMMVASSVMKPNECRALEDYDDDPNGDQLLVTKNLTTLANLQSAKEEKKTDGS